MPRALGLSGCFKLWTHEALRELMWLAMRRPINQAREEVLHLPPLTMREPFGEMDRKRQRLLYCYSAAVAPSPRDWGDWIHVSGYWFLDRLPDWRPPSTLVDFLSSGPPPGCIGFGSMTSGDAQEMTEMVTAALRLARRRGVLLIGWGGLSGTAMSDDVYVVDSVPHDWLFPHMAAGVHHAGTGSMAAAMRAGVPSASVPSFLDQHFWARRAHELGMGPRPIPLPKLTVGRLAASIREATSDQGMQARAAALGEPIRPDNGVRRAVEAIHAHFDLPSPTVEAAPVALHATPGA